MATTQEPKNAVTLKEKLQQQLQIVQQRIANANQEIADLRAQDKETIRQKADELRKRMDAAKQDADRRKNEISQWLEARKQHTEAQIATWRQKRELKHLQKRADKAEDYAINLVVATMLDADEAEVAVLDALEARLDADAAETATA
jgi:hypothetical protein